MQANMPLRRMRPGLGTWIEIQAIAATERQAERAIQAAFKAVRQVQTSFSIFEPQSELSQINAGAFARPQTVSPEVHALLKLALTIAESSEGAFDPTAGGKLRRAGCASALMDIDLTANWRDVELSDQQIRFHKRLQLDLGGIAKGYAVDQAIAALKALYCSAGVVNAGGDLRCFGPSLAVHLRDPQTGQISAECIALENQALATSGGVLSARRIGARAKTSLIGTKRIAWRQSSVSVLADTATIADALTKVMLFAPSALKQRHAEQFGAQVIYLQSARSG